MVKYSVVPADSKQVGRSKSSEPIHFKNAVEVCSAIRGMTVGRANRYLTAVLDHQEAIPFQRFKGGRGRHAQAKNLKVPGSLVGWPKNAVKAILAVVNQAADGAKNNHGSEYDDEKFIISHVSANQAPKGRRRTYRAHGRINAYKSTPAHLEVIIAKKQPVTVEAAAVVPPRLHRLVLARKMRVPTGGDAQ